MNHSKRCRARGGQGKEETEFSQARTGESGKIEKEQKKKPKRIDVVEVRDFKHVLHFQEKIGHLGLMNRIE